MTNTTRSNNKGQAIDGIWGTEGIHILSGVYLTYNKGPWYDHILIWVRIYHSGYFGKGKPPIRPPEERKLWTQHTRVQGNHIPRLRILLRQGEILPRIQKLVEKYSNLPSTQSINDYKDTNNLLMSDIRESNSKLRCLHMSNIHSYRETKMDQLCLRLSDQLIKSKTTNKRIKHKTVTKIKNITGRRWWIPIDINYLFHPKKQQKRSTTNLIKKLINQVNISRR